MPTLLVVDDEASILRFVRRAMIRRGWAVVQVDRVKEGLAVVRQGRIDVALCDVVMPDASGCEFATVMRQQAADVPVILMTGHPTAQLFAEQGLPYWWKPLPLLEKPFTLRELEAALEAALRSRERLLEAAM